MYTPYPYAPGKLRPIEACCLLQVLIPSTQAVFRKLLEMEELKLQAVESEIRVLVRHLVLQHLAQALVS